MALKERINNLKSNIKEQYELAKKNSIGRNNSFNFNISNLEKEYDNVIKLIDNEIMDFNEGKSHYSILYSRDLKEYKLNTELKTISDNFLRQIDILKNSNYISALEEELAEIDQQQKILDIFKGYYVYMDEYENVVTVPKN